MVPPSNTEVQGGTLKEKDSHAVQLPDGSRLHDHAVFFPPNHSKILRCSPKIIIARPEAATG